MGGPPEEQAKLISLYRRIQPGNKAFVWEDGWLYRGSDEAPPSNLGAYYDSQSTFKGRECNFP